MGFDKRGYYYRARKVNGRVVREYVGTGEVARLAAMMDDVDRRQRENERSERKALQAEMQALDDAVERFDELAERLARAALQAAGFHRHKRGEWRRRRERNEEPTDR